MNISPFWRVVCESIVINKKYYSYVLQKYQEKENSINCCYDGMIRRNNESDLCIPGVYQCPKLAMRACCLLGKELRNLTPIFVVVGFETERHGVLLHEAEI